LPQKLPLLASKHILRVGVRPTDFCWAALVMSIPSLVLTSWPSFGSAHTGLCGDNALVWTEQIPDILGI
jgi:hypothetical protein